MPGYTRADGVLIESLGHLWAAFSSTSGETALLNDESAAVLEVLEAGPSDTQGVASLLSSDSGVAMETLVGVVEATWPRLIEAGLVRQLDLGHASPQ